jgi:hypothetical protein
MSSDIQTNWDTIPFTSIRDAPPYSDMNDLSKEIQSDGRTFFVCSII